MFYRPREPLRFPLLFLRRVPFVLWTNPDDAKIVSIDYAGDCTALEQLATRVSREHLIPSANMGHLDGLLFAES